jgi:hypothetical protein
MTASAVVFLLAVSTTALPAEAEHERNPLYKTLSETGWTAGGTRVAFPTPRLTDGMSPEAEQSALRAIGGTDRAAAELTRDSVTAPFVLKTHDLDATGGVIRHADLWFVVRASLDAIDPARAAGGLEDGRPVEAGNMRFTGHRLTADEVAGRSLVPAGPSPPTHEWYVHSSGRLLDRLAVESTDRITASRTERSWVFAARTDPRLDHDKAFPNHWQPIARKGSTEEAGAAETYAGGASIVKISRLARVPGALLVEAHFAFFEPKAWFDGAPILRSKIGLVAQDRIRSLRRELAKSRKE